MTPKQRLVATARVVVERDGVNGLTLRAIAREAGVSHGAPLRHFPTLASLLAALTASGYEQLEASVAAAISGVEDPRARVSAAGRGYIAFALAQPGVYSVMFRAELLDRADPDYAVAAAAAFDQLATLVAAAQADGWRPEVPRDRLATLLWARVHGVADLWLHGVLDQDALDDLIELATEIK